MTSYHEGEWVGWQTLSSSKWVGRAVDEQGGEWVGGVASRGRLPHAISYAGPLSIIIKA